MSQLRRFSIYATIVGLLVTTILMLLPSGAAAAPAALSVARAEAVASSPHAVSVQPMQIAMHRVLAKTQVTYSVRVRPGDSLSIIAKRVYGNMAYWPALWRANKSKVPDFNSLLVGQRLTIPAKPAKIPKLPVATSHNPVNSAPAPHNPVGPPPVSGAAGKAVAFVYAQLGCPYVWGGNGPCRDGFDCSGLMQQAWLYAGITIPRVTWDIMGSEPAVSLHDLMPGDILGMYGNSHVGMYVGHGMMIDAPVPGAVVEKVPVPWGAVDGAVRP